MKIVNLLVGGPTDLWPNDLKLGKIKDNWIGVDRGSFRLIEMGINPIVSIGDYDSMNDEELSIVKSHVNDLRTFDPIKDDTDTQLALKIANKELNADIINIYGATGGRLDHFLSNFLMMTEPRYKKIVSKIRIIDNQNTISYFLPGSHTIKKELDKKYLAYLPLNEMNLTLNDVKYTLDNYHVARPISFASNEFIGTKANFSFDKGILSVIQSKDS
ncbi:thiamine diphosphokinase [Apilactobacillus timberlakei]|uniref:Thiamine diphosphokinase n=1 Tax=Apilactobacillus timberlakei TaxID=2008380 RepID=A0ABY2YV08_9LACO|nr:thiamine diphosphokinase [Apilactobacillus timberlakei]TPR13980.1 thiamine diphosphokinase [Apilactobacillus timberlakei]TPR15296.1 thiamine diphosphokinase [Apilactobacillus timberlakei]TPR16827.1 thiamine diphosphokinase [Apilactobacillus timberlakei]TPR17187.1 thiamine diphosphokinase [Apilactobacillus timberlakei]